MAKESTYSTATPTGTDYVRLIDDPGGTPVTANATVVSLADATNGATVYRIWDGMTDDIDTVWQSFWAETAKAVLIIEPKASGVYTLDSTDVTCTGSAATAEKYVFGNNQEVFTNTGSLLWRGAVGSSNNRVLFIDRLFFSAYSGDADSTGAGLVFQNTNWNHIDVRCKSTKVVVGTHTATGQCEFNWMRFDLQNCDTTSPLHFAAYSSGDGSMRGNQIHARIFGTTGIDNAWRCAMTLYHCNVELHVGGIGGAGGSPGANPNANYTGANAVFWIENDGSTDAGLHGSRLVLRDERGTGTGKVGLWLEDNGSGRRQEHSHIDFASIYAYDYMAVADFADPSELPRFSFGINLQTQVNSWTADDGTWKIPVMRWDGGRYNITDVPGVFADGVTDVDALIGTALSNGGAWYFPPGNYHLSAGVDITHRTHLDVECAAGVLFSTNGEAIDGDLFDFDTAVTDDDLVAVKWAGGTINAEGVLNPGGASASLGGAHGLGGLLNVGTQSTADVFSFRDGYWASIHVEGVRFFNRPDGHLTDPKAIAQHCMGDYTNGYNPGADTALFVQSGPGPVTIRDCVMVGFRDSGIYISGQGNSEATPPGFLTIDNVKTYHCGDGIGLKAECNQGAIISNCYAYNCFVGFQCARQSANPGADWVVFTDCTAEQFESAFSLTESDRCRVVNPTMRNPWWVDWGGSVRGSVGDIEITSDTNGTTITGITVNSVQVMSGTVTQSGTGSAARETFAKAVAANINAHTSTPDYKAAAWFNGTNWEVYISTTADAAEVDSTTVAAAGTASTTATPMGYQFDKSYGLVIDACHGTRVDSPHFTWDATAAGDVASDRGSALSRGFRIVSRDAANTTTAVDIQTLDTYITGAVFDGWDEIGGEATVASVANPDRTRVDGLLDGDGLTDHTGFAVLGASSGVDYGYQITKIQGSDVTIAAASYVDITDLVVPVYADAVYEVDALIVYDVEAADDLRIRCDVTGTESGYWQGHGPISGASLENSDSKFHANAWGENSGNNLYGGIGTADADDILTMRMKGILVAPSDGTCQIEVRLGSDTSGTDATVYANSYMKLTRIG